MKLKSTPKATTRAICTIERALKVVREEACDKSEFDRLARIFAKNLDCTYETENLVKRGDYVTLKYSDYTLFGYVTGNYSGAGFEFVVTDSTSKDHKPGNIAYCHHDMKNLWCNDMPVTGYDPS